MTFATGCQTAMQEKIIELSELAGGLAHEIRNPLSTLKVNLQLLAEDLRDEPDDRIDPDFRRRAIQRLETLRSETDRLQSLLDDFLRFVGRNELKTERADLNDVVRHLVEFVAPQAQRLGINLTASLFASPLPCDLDDGLFKQALLNLLINAQDAMPDGGDLAVTARPEGQWVRIDISDTGVGMETPVIERVFSPFFSTKKEGSGLGLSLTRRIVQDHGGSIAVQSKAGEGSTFTVRIPTAEHTAST
jgi:signal transduction histidine kinase